MKYICTLLFLLISTYTECQTVGTIINKYHSYDGYTLFSPLPDTTAYLIDNCGYVVNSWTTSYKPGLSAYLLEDGSLLRTGQINHPVYTMDGSGGQIQRYDWNGNLVWDYNLCNSNICQHHDIEYMPNGNILILARELKTQAECIAAGRNPSLLQSNSLWPELIVEIEPIGIDSGRIVWEWHAWDHMVQAFDSSKNNYQANINIPELFHLNYLGAVNTNSNADWMHANAIDYNPVLDQIVISSKRWSEFWIIDHSTTTNEAASHSGGNRGKGGDILYRWGNPIAYDGSGPKMLFDQHDVHWITNGNPDAGKIMIFNNGITRNWSSVDIIIPPVDSVGNYLFSISSYGPSSLYWTYSDTTSNIFYSRLISGAQQLPNGNVLICYGVKGKLFEIDSNKTLVWEYNSPVTNSGITTQGQVFTGQGSSIFRSYRYGPMFPGFVGKTLTPTVPVELSPNTSHCSLIKGIPSSQKQNQGILKLYPNPAISKITIETTAELIGETIIIYNLLGQQVYSQSNNSHSTEIKVDYLVKGTYLLTIGNIFAHKVIIL